LLPPQERLAAAVTETITVAEAAADEAAQQIMALQQDVSRLQATNAALHQTLEEVHTAAASYKQQLAAAGDRERELQRKLLQAQLVCEELGEQLRTQRQAAAAASSIKAGAADDSSRQDGGGTGVDAVAAQALLQQRDAANAALAEVQGQLQAQAAELQQVRQVLQKAEVTAAAAAAAGSGSGVVAGRDGNGGVRPHLLVLQEQQGLQPAAAAAAGEPSGSSWLDPDWHSALPSPVLNKLLASPGSGASFWLDSAREHSMDHHAPPAAAAEQAAVGAGGPDTAPSQQLHRHRSNRHPLSHSADSGLLSLGAAGVARGAGVAALAPQLLNREATNLGSIRDNLEDAAGALLGSSSSPTSPRPSSRLQHHTQNEAHNQQRRHHQQQQDQQVRELAAALVAAEAVGERQRAVIGALRQEMEELQAAGEVGPLEAWGGEGMA
jgi:hypothetical protein